MPDYVETNFDERSGFVPCETEWGRWWQTVAEVHVDVKVPEGTRSKVIQVEVRPSHIKVEVAGKMVFEGTLFGVVRGDETVWTLEDRKLVRIVMTKADTNTKENVWEGLLKERFLADPFVLHEMRKKLDLERFQMENPGFDFSGANLKKSYDKVPNSILQQWEEKKKKQQQEETGAAKSEGS
ncbi:nudC domain-containing protein 2-like [Eriocheir sinensis]|uniref:nudC domain-containing protein 2-like n=1 Tax=Eriocheir sinensis TaxID=95602 RepID=UPI0021CA836E|nr:nudC domain-containing protein 2-like [Eriocheir sinensis]